MTIQSVTSFEGTAEVGASVRPFRYDGAARELTIGDLDADKAVLLLREVGRGKEVVAEGIGDGQDEIVVAAAANAGGERVRVGGPRHGEPTRVVGKPAAESAPPRATSTVEPAVSRALEKPAASPEPAACPESEPEKPKAEDVKGPAKKRGAKKGNVQDDLDLATDPEATEEPPAEEPPAEAALPPQDAPKPSPKAGGSVGGNGLPEELTDAKKLRDVVSYFFDQGITDPDQIVARCVEVAPKVKVLARIKNVEDRVRRALEVLGMAG